MLVKFHWYRFAMVCFKPICSRSLAAGGDYHLSSQNTSSTYYARDLVRDTVAAWCMTQLIPSHSDDRVVLGARQLLLDVATNSSADELARLLHEAALILIAESVQVKGLDHTWSKQARWLESNTCCWVGGKSFCFQQISAWRNCQSISPSASRCWRLPHLQLPASAEYCKRGGMNRGELSVTLCCESWVWFWLGSESVRDCRPCQNGTASHPSQWCVRCMAEIEK